MPNDLPLSPDHAWTSQTRTNTNTNTNTPSASMTMSSSSSSSSSKSLLETLAARIAANAEAISAFNAQHGHPNRSFDRDAPTTLLPPGVPQDLRVKQQELLDASLDLQLLATDVNEYLVRQAVNVRSVAFHYCG